MPSLSDVRKDLRTMANPADARHLQRFFKTGPGQYGAGDVFLGIRVPAIRTLVRKYRDLRLADVERLLRSKEHEARLLALLIMVEQYKRGDEAARQQIFDLYLGNTRYVNNWDLVDSSAAQIVGAHLQPGGRALLSRLAKSELLWERRIAMIATFHYIRRGEFTDALRIAEMLLGDEHDLMHKAVGWMLREVGKKDRAVLVSFLDQHYRALPRTTLRYAIEHFDEPDRQAYLRG